MGARLTATEGSALAAMLAGRGGHRSCAFAALIVLASPQARSLRSRLNVSPAGRRRHSAFTIVELIVVVAIIALILGIGLPAFNAMSTSAKLAKTRQLLTG